MRFGGSNRFSSILVYSNCVRVLLFFVSRVHFLWAETCQNTVNLTAAGKLYLGGIQFSILFFQYAY